MIPTAQSLLLIAPRTLAWQDTTLPDLGKQDVLLETLHGGVSVGTELPQFTDNERSDKPLTYPRMTGYESFARVIAVGAEATRFQIGDRVVAFYGHRTHAVLHQDKPILVPDDIPPEIALSVILTCDVSKGIRKVNPMPESRVLVTGGGAIGLFTVMMLRAYGVLHVDMVEPSQNRREIALAVGATRAYHPTDTIASDYDFGFECSSFQDGFATLQTALKPHGKICVLSDGNREPLVLLPAFHRKELTIIGSSDGWDYQAHARWFFRVMCQQADLFDLIYDIHTKASQLSQTFTALANQDKTAIKIRVDYPPAT